MTTRLLTYAALLALPMGTMAQCMASYTYVVNGNTVTFDGTVMPPSPSTVYLWWFSDNNSTSTQEDPVHTFSGPGSYMVCMTVMDQLTQCMDSVCHTVTIAGGCNADFTAIDSLNTFSFFSTTTAPQPAQYVWDFGDGNYSNAANPSHTYASPGVYTVCLTVYDSLQNFCDSTCHPVTVQSTSSCSANFTWIDSLGYVFFLSNSNAGPGAMYAWDFGDGNYSNAANPSHIYANPGTYTVCFYVYDAMQNFCDSTCHTLQVTNTIGIAETNALQSTLSAVPNPADASFMLGFLSTGTGTAVITFFDAAGRIANEQNVNVHSAGLTKTEINTNHLSQGVYLVKIAVNGTSAWTKIAITHQ